MSSPYSIGCFLLHFFTVYFNTLMLLTDLRYIEAALDTKIKLKSKDLEIKALMDQVSELKAALVEYESKASNLEATMFSHFTEILNSKKRKIRHLNSLVGQANDPTNSSAG